MTMRHLVFCCVAIALAGCSQTPSAPTTSASPSMSTYLDDAQLREMQRLAKQGDVDAMHRVAAHYDFGVSRPEEAIYWLEMAAANGSPAAMKALAMHLSVRAKGDDCRRADELFRKALATSVEANERAKIDKSYAAFQRGEAAGQCGPRNDVGD